MVRSLPYLRVIVLTVLAAWLGYLVERDPGQTTLTIPEKGIAVTVPQSLEGWQLQQGEGAVLVTGHTRMRTISVELVDVPAKSKEDLAAYMQERHSQFKQGKDTYIVWHEGTDYKFGNRYAMAYKATYRDRFLGLPVTAEYWQHDVYWPYKDRFVRIGMRYPEFLARYVEPDKIMLGAGLKLAKQ